MNVIVTGGLGFIGSNLVKSLLKTGLSIIVLDNDSTGYDREKQRGVTYIDDCCSNIAKLDKFAPNYVIHLGEYSRVQQSYDEPLAATTNITSTLPYVLDFCRRHEAKLIYAGSSTKYGNADSPYSVAKALNTEFVDKYCQMFHMEYAITYFYNAYGDGECDSGNFATAVAKFIKAKKNNELVTIYGTGTNRRNFTHVADIVSGIELVMLFGKGDGYGIGSDKSYSVTELVKAIGVTYVNVEDVAGNRSAATLCTDKTKSIGWLERHDLMEYIECKIS